MNCFVEAETAASSSRSRPIGLEQDERENAASAASNAERAFFSIKFALLKAGPREMDAINLASDAIQ